MRGSGGGGMTRRGVWQRGVRDLLLYFHFRSLPGLPSGPVIFLALHVFKINTTPGK